MDEREATGDVSTGYENSEGNIIRDNSKDDIKNDEGFGSNPKTDVVEEETVGGTSKDKSAEGQSHRASKDDRSEIQSRRDDRSETKARRTSKDETSETKSRRSSKDDRFETNSRTTKARRTSKDDRSEIKSRRTSKDDGFETKSNRISNDKTPEAENRRMSTEDKTSEPADDQVRKEGYKGVELILAIKNKDKSAASKFISEGADVNFVDELQCNAIHYAAREGMDDLIAELVSHGGNVKRWDCDGDTPLHKAARTGHDSTVAVLVSYGANIDALNWGGVNPLECAVKRNQIKVIETLCMFGVDLVMQDEGWELIIAAKDSKLKKDQDLIDILKRHRNRLAGFKHGGIKYDIKYIDKGQYVHLEKVRVSIQGKEIPFTLFCCKLSAEYSSITKFVNPKQEPFGDVYECRKWGGPQKIFTISVKLKGALKSNETAEIASPDGRIGRIDETSSTKEIINGETVHYTELKVTITLKPNVKTTFMFVKFDQPEAYAITKEAIKIQPKIEPEAEIDIPKGTFDKPGELLLNVVDTKGVEKMEDEKPETDIVLLTNVLDISMSNHQQPNQPIDLALPMHFNIDEDMGVSILTSSKEFPEKIEDWEIFECIQDSRRKLARFKIPHFSICTAVPKKKLENNMLAVTMLVQAALKHERQVEFFAMAQTISEKEYAVVIECSLQRNAKKRKRHWRNKKYESQDPESFSSTVRINSWFQVKFEGNVKQTNTGTDDTYKLMFDENRENFRIFSVEVKDPKEIPMGRVKIELLQEIEQEPIEVVESACFGTKVTRKPQDPIQEYLELTSLLLHLKPLPPPQDSNDSAEKYSIELDDLDCTITVLQWSSLFELTKRFDLGDVKYLAVQLKRYSQDELEELAAEHQTPDRLLMCILKEWRGKRPHNAQVEFLAKALETVDKTDEANELRTAFQEERKMKLS